MSKSPAAKSKKNSKIGSILVEKRSVGRSFDWSKVLPPSRIKTQLQTLGEGDIGCLPKQTLQLISICSGLLLRKIVGESSQASSSILAATDLEASLEHEQSVLKFCRPAIQAATGSDDKKIGHPKNKKRKTDATDSSKINKKKLKLTSKKANINQEFLEQALVVPTEGPLTTGTESIVVDDEEYD